MNISPPSQTYVTPPKQLPLPFVHAGITGETATLLRYHRALLGCLDKAIPR